MRRSKKERGPIICHVCREPITTQLYRVPIRGVVGAHWIVCMVHADWRDDGEE